MFDYKQLHDVGPSWARQIRALALESHQLTRAPECDPIEVEFLLARIDGLRRELAAVPHAPGLRWLDALRAQVDSFADSLDDSTVITV